MSQILDRIIEGGPVFMVPILLILLASIVLTILAALGKRDTAKTRELIGHISLFAMIWGLLGSTIGLIVAFDAISAINDVETPAVAGGLKVALLNTVFGLFTFAISRIGMIILTLQLQKKSA